MKEQTRTLDPRRSEKLWLLVEAFFLARRIFNAIYTNYESRVLAFARERGVDRRRLRLNVKELGGLLNFKELEDLRDSYLHPLKSLSHDLFRDLEQTDKLDRYLSDIFHETSILKEEQYKVDATAAGYDHEKESDELEVILDEVHKTFPQKVHHLFALFRKAQSRLEGLLPAYRDDRVLLRSIFLHGPQFLDEVYEHGIDDFYRILFPVGGAFEGYYRVGRSFMESGFFAQARDSLERALAVAELNGLGAGERDASMEDARMALEKLRRMRPPVTT